MTRFLVWSTLVALIFAAKAEIEAVSEFAAKHNLRASQHSGGVQTAATAGSAGTVNTGGGGGGGGGGAYDTANNNPQFNGAGGGSGGTGQIVIYTA